LFAANDQGHSPTCDWQSHHQENLDMEIRQKQTESAKINARLQNHDSGRATSASVTTHPNRCVTNIYPRGLQANEPMKQGTSTSTSGATGWPLK
jgi:hypothetical protein